MRFRQIDRIIELVPNSHLVATKVLNGSEDYLSDHFPLFPVMPGVLMLEGLYQASCWLIRESDNMRLPILKLAEVRNAKFADFLSPGQTLDIRVDLIKQNGNQFTVKASGSKAGVTSVSARLLIECTGFENPKIWPHGDTKEAQTQDECVRAALRRQLAELQQ